MSAVSTAVSDREPCGVCGESLALAATTCVHCGASATVDVRLIPAITDGRVRYQVARAIAALGPPARPLPTLQTALAGTAAVLASGATREFARRIDAVLAPFQLQADASARANAGDSKRGLKIAASVAALVVTIGVLGYWKKRGAPSVMTRVSTPSAVGKSQPEAGPVLSARGQLVATVLSSTVAIRCSGSLGAGFFVAEDLVLTNEHVLCAPGDTMRIALHDGQTGTGDPVKSDTRLDIALVRVTGVRGRPLSVGDAGRLSAGDRVWIVGSPVGMEFTFHEGVVSNTARSLLGVSYIQVDARVNPGNSGGPLVDTSGQVVGMVSLKRTDAEGIGLALPINYAYSADVAMIPAPAGVTSGFAAMQAQALDAEAKDVTALAQMDLKPSLVAAHDDAYGRLAVRIVLPARGQPGPRNFDFHFRNGNQTICPLGATVTEWRSVASSEMSRSLGTRMGDFIKRNGLDVQLYVGEAALPVGNCRGTGVFGSDLTLEMEGADESASRIRIR
jgi:serine protease Do